MTVAHPLEPVTVIDPITLEIMRNRWKGIAEECCAALVRASHSTNIKDRRDCSAALALPNGEIVAQAEVGTPLHLGVMPGVIRAILARYPVARMQPGDVYGTNLPYPEGPGHLPDLSLVSPIFHDGRPIALAASTAHHVDMGGYAPGSMPFGVTEIYQEGLQIPPLPLVRQDRFDDNLLRLIEQNVRTEYELRGDLMAQYAVAKKAEQRVAELLARVDVGELVRYMEEILDHAERCMRAGIAELPDGTYRFEDFLDDDGVTDEPVKIAVAIRIAGDELTADFTGSSRQVLGPLNARISAAQAAVYYTCKAVIDPDLPTCAGSYRPIHVHAPEGSILQAKYPAAIGQANILTDQRVVDVLMGALAQCVPERVCAACSGEMNLINIGGIDSRPGPSEGDLLQLRGDLRRRSGRQPRPGRRRRRAYPPHQHPQCRRGGDREHLPAAGGALRPAARHRGSGPAARRLRHDARVALPSGTHGGQHGLRPAPLHAVGLGWRPARRRGARLRDLARRQRARGADQGGRGAGQGRPVSRRDPRRRRMGRPATAPAGGGAARRGRGLGQRAARPRQLRAPVAATVAHGEDRVPARINRGSPPRQHRFPR